MGDAWPGPPEQFERLEDEADLLASDSGQTRLRVLGNVFPSQVVFSGRRDVQASEDVHQGALARSTWPHDGDVLVLGNAARYSAQRMNQFRADAKDLLDIDQLDQFVTVCAHHGLGSC